LAPPGRDCAERRVPVGPRGADAVAEETIGALNLFSGREPPLSPADQALARALTDIATIGILQQRTVHRSALLAEQLQTALNTRTVIEQAKGRLAENGKVDMDTAFTALREFARSHQLKLGDVAQSLVRRERSPEEILSTESRRPSPGSPRDPT
jgi:hypothetical protein